MSDSVRNLVVVLGDQLDRDSAAFAGFETTDDRVWMAEVREESEHVWSHRARTTLFLSAMRHFRQDLEAEGLPLTYHTLSDNAHNSLAQALAADIERFRPRRVVLVQPGDYRVHSSLAAVVNASPASLDLRSDNHFLCDAEAFEEWAGSRKQLRLESFYREMRKRTGILMEDNGPTGGDWNYDKDNRQRFGKQGPGLLPPWPSFQPDKTTRDVIAEVGDAFPEHPGSLANFDWPVTRADARLALQDFVEHRLASFGPYQDAIPVST